MLVYSSGTIYIYPLYNEALVISRKAIAVSNFIITSYKTLAYVKPLLDILYHYTI